MLLSVLIPARNEEWLTRTVDDVLANIRGDSEVIVVLDGAWAKDPLVQHPQVTVIKTPVSIGQRAATNLAARVSNAKYVMKLDAHCRVSEGFDVALAKDADTLGSDVCTIPAQYNLHAFDWVCSEGHRLYQGPTPENGCLWKPKNAKEEDPICGKPVTRDIIWEKRNHKLTTAWRFDSKLHFQYWGDYAKEHPEDIHDVMSCLGACWFVDREHFLSLGCLDEQHGSWGQMGTELACKYWLSGGRMVVNKHAWYAHLFRTQGGDFSFPYPLTGVEQDAARKHSAWLWREGNWPLAKHDLHWLVTRFNPPGWKKEEIDALQTPENPPMVESSTNHSSNGDVEESESAPAQRKAVSYIGDKPSIGVVWYTDNLADERILRESIKHIDRALPVGAPFARVGIKLADYVTSWLRGKERGVLTMFEQILFGLESLNSEYAFLCEHDVLYHPSHFEHVPERGVYSYNINTWKVDIHTGKAVSYVTKQTSGLCASRALLIEHYTRRIDRVKREGFSRKMGFEPGSHGRAERVDDIKAVSFTSAFPNIDLRHDKNLTETRWSQSQFRDQRNCQQWKESTAAHIPGWPELPALLNTLR